MLRALLSERNSASSVCFCGAVNPLCDDLPISPLPPLPPPTHHQYDWDGVGRGRESVKQTARKFTPKINRHRVHQSDSESKLQ